MKTNKEMTESVLQRASQIAHQQKIARKRVVGLVAGSLCLVLILGLFLVHGGTEQPALSTQSQLAVPPTKTTVTMETSQPTGNQRPTELTLSFLSFNDTHGFQNNLPVGVCMPVDITLRVRSFSGLTGEERKQALQEELAVIEELKAEIYAYQDGYASVRKNDEGIVAMLCKGKLSLSFDDDDQVSSVEAQTLNGGRLSRTKFLYHEDFTLGEGEEQITYPVGSVRYAYGWLLNAQAEHALLGNPNMQLSTFSDTIKIIVEYKNGYCETIFVDVSVSDEGQVYMTMRGSSNV